MPAVTARPVPEPFQHLCDDSGRNRLHVRVLTVDAGLHRTPDQDMNTAPAPPPPLLMAPEEVPCNPGGRQASIGLSELPVIILRRQNWAPVIPSPPLFFSFPTLTSWTTNHSVSSQIPVVVVLDLARPPHPICCEFLWIPPH